MAAELRKLALDLKTFLVTYQRVTEVQGPEPLSDDWRHWQLRFTHRGLRRHYVYHMQRIDPLTTMFQALRADTNGELLVRVPLEAHGELLTNEIYYPPHG